MHDYPKIHSLFKRSTDGKTVLFDEWSRQEFIYLADAEWVFTEKVDGTNVRIHWDGCVVTVAGRSKDSSMPIVLHDYLTELFTPERLRAVFPNNPTNATLYGEGFGWRIQQAGPKYGPTPRFALFDVKVGPWWLERDGLEDVAAQLDVPVVPVVFRGTLREMITAVRVPRQSNFTDTVLPMEGMVGKPAMTLLNRDGSRIMVKLKLKDFKHYADWLSTQQREEYTNV